MERLKFHLVAITAFFLLTAKIDLIPDLVYAAGVRLTPSDRSFDLIFSGEKLVLLPLVLLAVSKLHGLNARRENARRILQVAAGSALLGAVVLVGPALLIEHVEWEPKLPGITPVWVIHNLFFVCVLEELLFRNYLLECLRSLFRRRSCSGAYAVLIASLLFGLYHFRGGAPLMALAGIAGAVYALAYSRAGIVAAILAHFGVNSIHFLFFSYPSLA